MERLTGLHTYVESIADENERLHAYLEWANATADYERYRATHPDATASEDDAPVEG